MKRILSLVLILILSLGVLTACVEPETPTPSYDLQSVSAYLRSTYMDLIDNPETRKDFTLISSLSLKGAAYTIEWKANTPNVTVEAAGNDEVTVKVTAGTEDINYKLTGTIKAPDNSTLDLVFDLVIPAAVSGPAKVENPQPGVAYFFGMYQGNKAAHYYLKGGMSGYYMATTNPDDSTNALRFYIEETTGGYYLYCYVDGVKTYVNFVVSGTHVNGAYEATPTSVFNFNENGIFSTMVNDVEYGFGTYDNYVTLGPCKTSYADNFFGYFFTAVESSGSGNSGNDSGNSGNSGDSGNSGNSGNTGATPTVPAGVASLQVGKGYKVVACNSSSLVWVTSGITGGRFNGSTSESDALVMYVEAVDGGYLLYTKDGNSNTYICMDDKSAGAKTTTNAAEATVYEWDADLKTLVVADDDNARAFGTQNTSTYTTFSSYAVSNAGDSIYVWGQFIAAN